MSALHSFRYTRLLGRLREARRQAGLTQAEAARAVGKPQSFISKCESGERRVDVVELLELARLYGKGLGFFVAQDEDEALPHGEPAIAAEKRPAYGGRFTRGEARLSRRRKARRD